MSPSDSCGAAGPSNYVQVVNDRYAIFDKFTGEMLTSQNGKQLYATFDDGTEGSDSCRTACRGDPTVAWDQHAERWVFSEFAWVNDDGPYFQCFAVSKTTDVLGDYHYYAFEGLTTVGDPIFPDYGKLSVWPDAYYMSIAMFGNISADEDGEMVRKGNRARAVNAEEDFYPFAQICAYNKTAMLNGLVANSFCVDFDESYGIVFAASIDSAKLPPDGVNGYNYAASVDVYGSRNTLWIWKMSFTDQFISLEPVSLLVDTFTLPCDDATTPCIQQPEGEGLDSLADRVMYRVPYNAFSGYESILVTHTVRQPEGLNNQVAMNWYEVRTKNDGQVYVYQQGTQNPDDTNRWMGSIAMNVDGDIVLGYSVSSTELYPGIRYAYRHATDEVGTFNSNEMLIVDGTGYQNNTYHRWGDYSCMQVDPVDQKTFWYSQQYIAVSGRYNWATRIAHINLSAINDDVVNDDVDTNSNSNNDNSLSTTNIILIVVFTVFGGLLLVGGIAYFVMKSKASSQAGNDNGPTNNPLNRA